MSAVGGRSPWAVWLTAALAAVWVGAHLLTLDRYPPVSCDEAFYADAAMNFVDSGRFGFGSYLGIAGSDVSLVALGRLALLPISLSTLVFGPTLWAARLPSLLGWLAAVWVAGQLGREAFSRRVGLLAALLLLLTWQSALHGHFARPEAMLVLAGLLSLLTLLRLWQAPSFAAALIAGLVASLAVDVHLNAIVYALAAGVIAVVIAARARSWAVLGGFALGGAVGLGWFVAVHVLPNPDVFRLQMFELYAAGTTSPPGEFLWVVMLARNGGAESLPTLLGTAGAVAVALRDKRETTRLLLGWTALTVVLFTVLVSAKSWYYGYLWTPVLYFWLAAGLDSVVQWLEVQPGVASRLPGALRTRMFVAASLPLLVAVGGLSGYLMVKFRGTDLEAWARPLLAQVPPEASLLAPHDLLFARPDDPFVATAAAVWYAREQGLSGVDDPEAAAWLVGEAMPGYAVSTEFWLCLESSGGPSLGSYEAALAEQCEVVPGAAPDTSTGYPDATLWYCAGE